MKFYLLNVVYVPFEIEIDTPDTPDKSPVIKNVNKDIIICINRIFTSYELPRCDQNATKVELSKDQLLALILSSVLPVHAENEKIAHAFILPFTNQRWLYLSANDLLTKDRLWKNIDCKLLPTNHPTHKDLVSKLLAKTTNDLLKRDGQIFINNCQELVKTKPYHPFLPTADMLKSGEALLYSDHLPQLFTVAGVKVLSWNILHPRLCSGYEPYTDYSQIDKVEIGKLPNDQQKKAYEDAQNSQKKKRADRICDSLVKMITQQQPRIITLQENFIDAEGLHQLIETLQQKLGQNWKFNQGGLEGSLVTFYNSDLYENKSPPVDNEDIRSFTSSFLSKKGEENLDVHNLHIPHEEAPFKTAEVTQKLLRSNSEAVVIGVGDFNSRIPRPESENFLPTGVTPPQFGFGVQGCDWTDGCYSFASNNEVPVQAQGVVLNPSTGEVFKQSELSSAQQHDMSLAQRQEMNRLRPLLDIADERKATKIGNRTLLEVEASLQKYLNDPHLKICLAANAYNQRGFAIVSDKLINYIKQFPHEILIRRNEQKEGPEATTVMMCCDVAKLIEFENFLKSLEAKATKVKYKAGFFRSEFQCDSLISTELLELSCFKAILPEKPQAVDKIRMDVKEKIKGFLNPKAKFISLCAKLVLANYHLHFNEYTVSERENMGNPKGSLIRPTHFQSAVATYLDICTMFAKENIYLFTPLQRQIIKSNLIELGHNIQFIYDGLAQTFSKQTELFEKRISKDTKVDASHVRSIVHATLVRYPEVLSCQKLLLAKETPFCVENDAEKGACSIGAVSLGDIPVVNLVKSYWPLVHPEVKPVPRLTK